MSQNSDQPPRQPPRFVPTLTDMVRPEAEPLAVASPQPAAVPAVFADILKDWPVLGPGAVDAPAERPNPSSLQDEELARRVEALVMQRLPALMTGLVKQAVVDALAEEKKSPR